MVSSRRRQLLRFGIPIALTASFLVVDIFLHGLSRQPWPDVPHLILVALLLVGSFVILSIYERTQLQRAETRRDLAAREASYRTQFDMFPEPTTVWSRDGVLLMQNLVSARNLGGKREDFLGKTIVELFGQEAGQSYLERMQQVFRTGISEEREDEVALSDGQHTFWTSMQRVTPPGGEDAVQVISYDITERVKAERALREEHERAATYLKVAGTLFVALDLNARVTLINERVCEVLGYQESEIVNRDWIADFLPERTQKQVRADFQAMLAGVYPIAAAYESVIVTRSGEERLVAWHGVMLRDDQGRPIGSLSSGEDITERRRAEQALRASETLRIQEHSALAERQRLARELHDSVSQALYGVALGVNTALTVLDRDREAARSALNYAIGLARAGLSEMRALIFELRPESLESEGLVVALQKQADAARVRFEIPVSLEVCAEPTLPLPAKEALYRIAQEALHNAVKHAEAREIRVRLMRDDDCLVLAVQDDGVGFDPLGFHPGHLGLKSMQERAASAGGVLHITSAPGAGTLVQAQVPLHQVEG